MNKYLKIIVAKTHQNIEIDWHAHKSKIFLNRIIGCYIRLKFFKTFKLQHTIRQ